MPPKPITLLTVRRVTITRYGYRCLRCQHVTITRDGKPPVRCGQCKSPYWRRPPRQPKQEQ